MFDIFVFLFENYIHADACPDGEQLARKLSAAGFEDEEISAALAWLNGLREACAAEPCDPPRHPGSFRIYGNEEQRLLDPACRGFILFLENAGVLDSCTRELVIERATALGGERLTLYRLKLIVLMVLWQREHPMDTLILDELLYSDDEDDEFALQ